MLNAASATNTKKLEFRSSKRLWARHKTVASSNRNIPNKAFGPAVTPPRIISFMFAMPERAITAMLIWLTSISLTRRKDGKGGRGKIPNYETWCIGQLKGSNKKHFTRVRSPLLHNKAILISLLNVERSKNASKMFARRGPEQWKREGRSRYFMLRTFVNKSFGPGIHARSSSFFIEWTRSWCWWTIKTRLQGTFLIKNFSIFSSFPASPVDWARFFAFLSYFRCRVESTSKPGKIELKFFCFLLYVGHKNWLTKLRALSRREKSERKSSSRSASAVWLWLWVEISRKLSLN